jgi:protein-tyrosine phosphatase
MGASASMTVGDSVGMDLDSRLVKAFLRELCTRPSSGLTEVRRDGKDNKAVAAVIQKEFERAFALFKQKEFISHMRSYAAATWATMEAVHTLMLEDEKPENERERLDPDHWYENNLTNVTLFANLTLEGMHELVPGRLFTTRMPRDLVTDPGERRDWLEKCRINKLKVICVLTEEEEFEKYSGMEGLLDFYRQECGLTVYNRAIPDFQIPTSGDLVKNILDLTYHLSQGRNCLVHCAGGSGRTGMVIAAVIKNLGVFDPVARIRKVKSTYVETIEQEKFLKNMPKALDDRIVQQVPNLARAIAAEHLLQVFLTHGADMDKAENRKDIVDELDEGETDLEVSLKEAYRQTFDLVDADESGSLDREELVAWLDLCGAEINVSKITDALLVDGSVTRERFAELMCSSAASSRRDYDV